MKPPRSNRHALLGAALMVLALTVLAGCGSSTNSATPDTSFTPVAGTETAYCDTYRGWQVHEFNGEGPDQPNPAALRTYWSDYMVFLETSLHQTPTEIRDELEVDERATRTRLTPVLEKYGFDVKRIEREGTAAEQALLGSHLPT